MFKSDLGDGLEIELQYKTSGYERYEWIQTVITDNPIMGKPSRKPYNDYLGRNKTSEPPFYFPRNKLEEQNSTVKGYNVRFVDGPNRAFNQNNYYWRAELSLIGYKNGAWHHVETFRYGFEVRNNVVMPYQFKITQPIYNSYYINQLNK